MEYRRDVEEQILVVDIGNNVMVKELMVLRRMKMMNQHHRVQY
jgi:hypothetical protein